MIEVATAVTPSFSARIALGCTEVVTGDQARKARCHRLGIDTGTSPQEGLRPERHGVRLLDAEALETATETAFGDQLGDQAAETAGKHVVLEGDDASCFAQQLDEMRDGGRSDARRDGDAPT